MSMTWKMYKPGQGYYTRMASFVGASVLVLGLVNWFWEKLSVITEGTRYYQGASALIIIAIFGTLIYNLTAVRPKTCDFMIATEGEMKKVNWPTKKEIIGSTWVVICCVFLIALVLYLSDMLFASIFKQIGILDI